MPRPQESALAIVQTDTLSVRRFRSRRYWKPVPRAGFVGRRFLWHFTNGVMLLRCRYLAPSLQLQAFVGYSVVVGFFFAASVYIVARDLSPRER